MKKTVKKPQTLKTYQICYEDETIMPSTGKVRIDLVKFGSMIAKTGTLQSKVPFAFEITLRDFERVKFYAIETKEEK